MRRRRLATREPNGRPSRAGADPEYAPAQLRRLRDAVMRGLADAEWGSELGLYFMGSKISSTMYAAGKRWRQDVADYLAAIGVRRTKSLPLEPENGTPPDPDSPLGQKLARGDLIAFQRFDDGLKALQLAGAERVTRAFVEQDRQPVGTAEFLALQTGLRALAQHYGYEQPRKVP